MALSGRSEELNVRSTDSRTGGPAFSNSAHIPVSGASLPHGPLAAEAARQVLEAGLEPEEHHVRGMCIGPYRLVSKLGEGGFGIVWKAEQDEPIRRVVALKVIKSGMDTEVVVARFETERQALALMDHPNIARVFDAGTTPGGRPFFVMEMVRGVPLTEYCDSRKLSLRARLELFVALCRGVEHAHQKRLIHRDLKPSNILVTEQDGNPVPKIIDFGIAKATVRGAAADPHVTQLHSFVGTPVYTSPEQLESGSVDIDTRSDIYSLGVILYELLAGRPPFDAIALRSAGVEGMRRTIREIEPLRLPQSFSTLPEEERTRVASARSCNPDRLASLLRGDLDWITMRCLERERARRYATASGLADDVLCHLRNEPVAARPPGRWYRFGKLVRRNRLVFAAAAAVAATLAISAAVATWQAVRAVQAERAQSRLRELAEQAQAGEAAQRLHAEARELAARRQAYFSDMNRAQQTLAMNNLGKAQALLSRQRPEPGSVDLRGWEWRYLWSQAQPDPHEILAIDTGRVGRISMSSDGVLLARDRYSVLNPGLPLLVMNRISRSTVFEDPHGSRPVFAHAGTRMAYVEEIAGGTDALSMIDLSNGRKTVLGSLRGRFTKWIGFTSDDRLLVVVGPGYVAAWNSVDGRKLWERELNVPGHAFQLCDISPDGTRLACVAIGGRFRVLDMASGSPLLRVVATDEQVVAVAFAPDSSQILTTGGLGSPTIRVWDAVSGESLGELEGHQACVTSLRFTDDGRRLYSGASDHTIRVWEWPSRRPVRVLRGHKNVVDGLALLPGGESLISHSADGAILKWEVGPLTAVAGFRKLPVQVGDAQLSPDSHSAVTVGSDGTVTRWNTSGMNAERQWHAPADLLVVTSIVYPDASRVLMADGTGRIHELDLSNGALRRDVIRGEQFEQIFVTGDSRHMLATMHDSNGSPLTTRVSVWDVATWQPTGTFTVPGTVGTTVFCSIPQRAPILAVHCEGQLQLWDVTAPEQPMAVLRVPPSWYPMGTRVDVSPDRRWVAANHGTGYFAVWDLTQSQPAPAVVVRAFLKGGHSVAISPDGNRLAVASGAPEVVKLWDVGTWEELITLPGEGSNFYRLRFSADGNTLMGLNRDGACYFWSAPTWEEIAEGEKRASREGGAETGGNPTGE